MKEKDNVGDVQVIRILKAEGFDEALYARVQETIVKSGGELMRQTTTIDEYDGEDTHIDSLQEKLIALGASADISVGEEEDVDVVYNYYNLTVGV